MTRQLSTCELRAAAPSLHAGDRLLLSGRVFTARDAAHKRLFSLLDTNGDLPFPLQEAVIYYCGATPAPAGRPIGSCGPTTSGRMDIYTPRLYDLGVCATIGKGERSPEVQEAILRNRGLYLCALGGAGALAAKCVRACTVLAFEELGCESVKCLEMVHFPLFVAIDCYGENIFVNKEKEEGVF